ncbi:hypothetical protein Tco_0984532, partial [Tanacetum coccineum]
IDQSAGGKLRDRNVKESWALLEDLSLYDNESWNDPRDFAKPVKAISLPQDVPSTSDRHLIELKNQVQRLMEAHIAPMQPTQVNKITSSCEISSGPHDTQYCMENSKQAFVEYPSSCTDEAGGKWYPFKPEQNNFGYTYNPLWKSHPNLRWRQPQNSQNNFSNPPNHFQPNGSIPNRSFNNNNQNFNPSNLKGLVPNFMASQDARLSKFEADFKQQKSEMTNKIDTVLKAIGDRMAEALPSDTVKNPKLNINLTPLVSSARSKDPQCSIHIHCSINTITIHPKQQSDSYNGKPKKNEEEEKGNPEDSDTNPSTPPDPSVSFISEKSSNSIHSSNRSTWSLSYPTQNLFAPKGMMVTLCLLQGEVPTKIEDPGLFTLPCRLGNSEPFDTLADLGLAVNHNPVIPFKKLQHRTV